MAGTNYKINPVKATCIRYKDDENSIQGLNDTCYGICAAFSGSQNVYMIDPDCAKSCQDFIEKKKKDIFGVGSCDHQTPYKPVIWNQVPRFVPKLLQKGLTVEQSREQCKVMCDKSTPMLAAECREYCDVDANAVEVYKEEKPKPKVSQPTMVKTSLKQEETKHPVLFWSVLVLLILCVIFGGIYIYKKWN